MGFSDVIAIFALVVSVTAAWLSYKARLYTMDSKESETRRGFSREKSEFLVRIEKAQKLFGRLERQLTISIQKVKTAPETVKISLSKEVNDLNLDLSYLEGCHRQARSLWDETSEMNLNGFAHHQPRFLKLIEDDEEFAREANQRLQLVEDSL